MFMKLSTTVLVALCFCQVRAQTPAPCTNLLTCGDCIRTAGCVWCNSLGYAGSRCFARNVTSASGCNSIMDPRSSPTSTYTQMPTDSIFSTTPSISLRAGDPLTINISVVSLPNTPLDLYILMDLSDSMGGPLASVKNVSQAIAQQVSSITTNVRIGFGSFNDKPIQPFSQYGPAACIFGDTSCAALTAGKEDYIQYSFFHRVNFTSTFSLPNVQTTKNFDLPESSFDALAQVLACEQQLGWRSRTAEGPDRGLQRLVLFITDDQPHLAGDGRLSGIYQAYDGKCHLKPYSSSVNYIPSVVGEQIYNEDSLLYDYPSVGMIANLLNTYQVIPIFAIVPLQAGGTRLESYVGMQDLFKSIGVKAFARPVLSGATNLLSVISTVYQEVVQTVALTLPTESDLTISLSQVSCPSNSTTVGQTCTNVGLNQIAQFSVTLTLKDCSSPLPSSLTFSVPGFGLTTISINKICGCSCDSIVNVSSSVCSYQGNLTCGGCQCVSSRTGAYCETAPCSQTCLNGGVCQTATGLCSCPPITTNQSTAVPTFYNDSTHGILLPPDVPSYAGSDCNCTNYNNCPFNGTTNYICSGRGKCACGACKCAATPYTWTWQGTACDCPTNPSDCFDTTFLTGALCGGQGTCSCDTSGKGRCVCSSGYTGTYCGTKIEIPSCSDTIGNCALNPASCNSMYTINSTSSVSSGTQPCYITSGLCTFKYVILPNSQLQIDKQNPSCQFEAWKIALILIGSILALFVLILIIVKIILVILDYVEVKRWEKELKEADFSKNQNPLYQSPEMQYTNVAYGKAM